MNQQLELFQKWGDLNNPADRDHCLAIYGCYWIIKR